MIAEEEAKYAHLTALTRNLLNLASMKFELNDQNALHLCDRCPTHTVNVE